MGQDGIGIREDVMGNLGNLGKSRKRIVRGEHYQTMAAGYQILKSPLAGSYNAAARHYRESDLSLDAPDGSDTHAARELERDSRHD
jgi:hypothetical protein